MECNSDVGFSCLPYAVQSSGYRCLEWTLIRGCTNNHNPEVEHDSKNSEGDEDTSDGGIDGRQVFAQSASEEEKGSLEHDRETFNEEMEGPLLEPITFALPISTSLNRRPACMPQVSVEPLFTQHCDECGKQGDRQARVHEPGDGDDFTRGIDLGGWNGSGFVRDGRLIEGEEDRTEEGCGLIVWIGLETRVDVDDERGANGGE